MASFVENLRRYKPVYSLYNLFRYKQLKHNLPAFHKYGVQKAYYAPVSSKDFVSLTPEEKPWLDVQNSADVLPVHPVFQSLPAAYQQSLVNWSANGYALLEGFYSVEVVDEINAIIEQLLKEEKVSWNKHHKVMFAIHQSQRLRELANPAQLQNILDMLLGKPAALFQSINFYRGSEQRAHSDSIHMTTFPQGFLVAAWIALEDITAGSGELFYYPGSHLYPYIMNGDFGNAGSTFTLGKKDYKDYEDAIENVVKTRGAEKKCFLARKGDVFIWHANLLHGGAPITHPDTTRKSMVMHFFARDVIAYHELTERPAIIVSP